MISPPEAVAEAAFGVGVFVFREEPEADGNLRAGEELAGEGAAGSWRAVVAACSGAGGVVVHGVNAGVGRARRGPGR